MSDEGYVSGWQPKTLREKLCQQHYVDEGDIISVEIDTNAYSYFERD